MANIPDEQMKALKREFMGIDVDGNGEVSIEELGTLLRSMPPCTIRRQTSLPSRLA